jgi:glycosyltransferase involved in cell wall biosynthesis
MASGVPVACSNMASLPEVAADAALSFDPTQPKQIAQAIRSLVDDESLRDRLVHLGKVRAKEFLSSERMASEYWDIFQELIERQSPRLGSR